MQDDSFILGHLDNGNEVGCVFGEIEVITFHPPPLRPWLG